jgi:hypothetical protein
MEKIGRLIIVQDARMELEESLLKIEDRHKLSFNEVVILLSNLLASRARWAIRKDEIAHGTRRTAPRKAG